MLPIVVGDACVVHAEIGEKRWLGFVVLPFTSWRIESMVTLVAPMDVSKAKGGKQDAGTRFCKDEPEETAEAMV